MITIEKANPHHVEGIIRVCSESYWATYKETHSEAYIQRVVSEFYHYERVLSEVVHTSRDWGGYFVALDHERVVGAGGGGIISDHAGEIFVLYLDPNRRYEGIGTLLLNTITEQQKNFGASEQWVSVQKGNMKGIPFYEAKGFQLQYEKLGYGNVEGESYRSLRYWRKI
ncbi:GNAT family N-acetyltransferase [Alkalibacillus aidingensis]|uniref:GNAT family N-acetyltransferase n=1 Tax=Alkalibacillus aidingensis TaxID=2747607 RepID=UPI00166050D0|nr:GNAT family N-acetyltransferase [Alkalibacillus aidingensis]